MIIINTIKTNIKIESFCKETESLSSHTEEMRSQKMKHVTGKVTQRRNEINKDRSGTGATEERVQWITLILEFFKLSL